MTAIHLTRVSPSTTIQDRGRPGALQYGISASGPMDRGAFERALASGKPACVNVMTESIAAPTLRRG